MVPTSQFDCIILSRLSTFWNDKQKFYLKKIGVTNSRGGLKGWRASKISRYIDLIHGLFAKNDKITGFMELHLELYHRLFRYFLGEFKNM